MSVSLNKKQKMALKMKRKKHGYESFLDDFIKHGKEREEKKSWEYARENRMSDKRMF